MKFIKFTLSSKKTITLPYAQAQEILTSPLQVVMIKGKNGEWDGTTINKSFIVNTERDYEEEKAYEMSHPKPQLLEPELTKEQKERNRKFIKEIGDKLKVGK